MVFVIGKPIRAVLVLQIYNSYYMDQGHLQEVISVPDDAIVSDLPLVYPKV